MDLEKIRSLGKFARKCAHDCGAPRCYNKLCKVVAKYRGQTRQYNKVCCTPRELTQKTACEQRTNGSMQKHKNRRWQKN